MAVQKSRYYLPVIMSYLVTIDEYSHVPWAMIVAGSKVGMRLRHRSGAGSVTFWEGVEWPTLLRGLKMIGAVFAEGNRSTGKICSHLDEGLYSQQSDV